MGAEQSSATLEEIADVAEDPVLPPSALVICGPSGVGKGTLIELLLEDSDDFALCISHTTRKPRGSERARTNIDDENRVEYYFVDKAEFERGIEQKAFLEYAKVHDHYYGTSKAAVESVLNSGTCCILDIDVQGARQVRKNGIRAVFVFVAPPSEEELEARLRERGTETEDQIFTRLKNARTEMQSMSERGLFDFCIVNGDLSQAYAELRTIATKAKNGYLPESVENGTWSPTAQSEKEEIQQTVSVNGMEKWKSKIALVTQAGSPAGMEICMTLYRAGMRLLVVERHREQLESLQKLLISTGISAQNFLPVMCDTTKEGEVLSLRKIAQKRWPQASSVDVLINVASHVREQAGLMDGSTASWVDMLSTNVLGSLMCSREVVKAMSDREEGGIVINISAMDKDSPPTASALFTATSHAIQSISQELFHEVKERGIDVISIVSDRRVDGSDVARAVVMVLASEAELRHIAL